MNTSIGTRKSCVSSLYSAYSSPQIFRDGYKHSGRSVTWMHPPSGKSWAWINLILTNLLSRSSCGAGEQLWGSWNAQGDASFIASASEQLISFSLVWIWRLPSWVWGGQGIWLKVVASDCELRPLLVPPNIHSHRLHNFPNTVSCITCHLSPAFIPPNNPRRWTLLKLLRCQRRKWVTCPDWFSQGGDLGEKTGRYEEGIR